MMTKEGSIERHFENNFIIKEYNQTNSSLKLYAKSLFFYYRNKRNEDLEKSFCNIFFKRYKLNAKFTISIFRSLYFSKFNKWGNNS